MVHTKKDLQLNIETEEKVKKQLVIITNKIEYIKNRFIYFGRKKKLAELEVEKMKTAVLLQQFQIKLKKQEEYVKQIYDQLQKLDVYIGGEKLHMENIEI